MTKKDEDQVNISMQNEIDSYIAAFPENVRKLLEDIRSIIKQIAPEATETIKYGIPTHVLKGNLVHYAAYEKHIGFYPAPSGIEAFSKELAEYKQAKGSVQFPLSKPIPLDLISQIARYRVSENLTKKK